MKNLPTLEKESIRDIELFERKFRGETYKFILGACLHNGNINHYIKCITPENCFGYPDIVLLNKEGEPYTMWRPLQNNILYSIKKTILKLNKHYGI